MQHKMPIYFQCNMKLYEHILAYIVGSVIATVVIWQFYHVTSISVLIGCLLGIYIEKLYAESTIAKRKRLLRLQFKDFLASMGVAARAGNVEIMAIKSALKDLKISYNDKADIVCEIENILLQYEKGGIELKVLFEDLANRSDIEDISNFATIYSVIEGKSDRFSDILIQTEAIISDKIQIEQEIETTITSAKSETMIMLIMPIVIVVAMSAMGSGLTDSLFTTMVGRVATTIALVIFGLAYVLAIKGSKIEA